MRFFNWLCRATGLLALVLALALIPALYFAGQWMQVHDQPQKADYILALAGDAHRFIHAADLYKQGYAPTILVSIPAQKPPTILTKIQHMMGYPDFDSAESYAKAFYGVLDVPQEVLQPFGNGHLSTVEEAEALREHLGPDRPTLLLVTSPYHARRAKLVFESVLPEARIIMTVTPYEHFDEHWWKDYYTAPKVVLEAAKCVHWLLGGVFRSTD